MCGEFCQAKLMFYLYPYHLLDITDPDFKSLVHKYRIKNAYKITAVHNTFNLSSNPLKNFEHSWKVLIKMHRSSARFWKSFVHPTETLKHPFPSRSSHIIASKHRLCWSLFTNYPNKPNLFHQPDSLYLTSHGWSFNSNESLIN